MNTKWQKRGGETTGYLGRKAKEKSTRAFCPQNANDRGQSHAVSAAGLLTTGRGITRKNVLVRGTIIVDYVPSTGHYNIERIVEHSGQHATEHTAPAGMEREGCVQENMQRMHDQNFNVMLLSLLMPADCNI